ncbi:DUF5716 family protein [Lachnospiraceae bacterium OttesenSCG-928-D06]|nr:DUF5716 family protein [Lachnospiraceae bacterium OttesenSCG-928-D06]
MLLKFGKGKIYVGYDLGNTFSQISYCLAGDVSVSTISAVAGEESYNIETLLLKRHNVNQWLYGKEALKAAQNEEGILVENLVEMALDGESVLIEGNAYEPVALLTLFVKKSLALLSMVAPLEKIAAFTFTCESMERRMQAVLETVLAGLNLKTSQFFLRSYPETYYYFMLHQPEELMQHSSALFEYRAGEIKVNVMRRNNKTTPIVITIEEDEYPFTKADDLTFLTIAAAVCKEERFSSIYLIGEGFDRSWMKESLAFLCERRRVFQGNNLYSKGACFFMQEQFEVTNYGSQYVYFGKDKLKANVGMRLFNQGEQSYCVLLDAGTNWYEAENVTEFYIQGEKVLEILITSLKGANSIVAKITLEGLESAVTRLRMHVFMKSESRLVVEVENLGFGELIWQNTNRWHEEMELY